MDTCNLAGRMCSLLLILPMILTASVQARAQDTASVLVQRRVYEAAPTRNGTRELVVDLYRPLEEPVRGGVVVMHGGGFTESYVDVGENKIYGQSLAQRGYVAAAIAFRSVEDHPVVSGWAREYADGVRGLEDPRLEAAMEQLGSHFPDAVAAASEDLVTAVEWLRDHAEELGFDPERVAVFGASSGSISAITTAYAMELYGEDNLDVAAVIDLRGLLLRPDTAGNPFDPDEPPLLMLHGEEDRSFRLPEVEAFYRLAREAGTPVQFYTSPEHGHDLGGPGLLRLRVDGEETVLDRIDAFLRASFEGKEPPGTGHRGKLLPAPKSRENGGDDATGRAPTPRPAASDSQLQAELREAVGDLIRSVEEGSDFVPSLYGISRPDRLKRGFRGPARRDWSYWPRDRAGLSLRHMTADQRIRTHRVLSTLLSAKGYLQINHIMMLEEILAGLETAGFGRGAEDYTVTIFGEPSAAHPWGLRFEGHHLSLNVTLAPEGISVTPSFLGASPAPLAAGIRAGFNPLAHEQQRALELLESLTPEQRATAVLADDPPSDILTTQFQVDRERWNRWQETLSRRGVPVSTFDRYQKKLVLRLLRHVVGTYREEIGAHWLDRIDVNALTFAWMGEAKIGRPHYFRIQGVHFVFELDAAQGDGTHVHTVWRDRAGDFGGDVLREHYRGHAPHGGPPQVPAAVPALYSMERGSAATSHVRGTWQEVNGPAGPGGR